MFLSKRFQQRLPLMHSILFQSPLSSVEDPPQYEHAKNKNSQGEKSCKEQAALCVFQHALMEFWCHAGFRTEI